MTGFEDADDVVGAAGAEGALTIDLPNGAFGGTGGALEMVTERCFFTERCERTCQLGGADKDGEEEEELLGGAELGNELAGEAEDIGMEAAEAFRSRSTRTGGFGAPPDEAAGGGGGGGGGGGISLFGTVTRRRFGPPLLLAEDVEGEGALGGRT